MTLSPKTNPPCCYPAALFEACSDMNQQHWWVVRTKSRQEKALAWNLQAKEISYFLPLITRPRKKNNRMRTSVIPLFSGYLFVKGDTLDCLEVLRTNRVAQLIKVADQKKLQKELDSLARVMAGQVNLELCDFVTGGQHVKIISGHFNGLEGIVKKIKNRHRVILQVTEIHQAISIELDLDMVKAI